MSGYPGGIVDFLLARLAEDEAAARATTPVPGGHWVATRSKHADDDAPVEIVTGQHRYGEDFFLDDPEGYRGAERIVVTADCGQDGAKDNLFHIARHDPARVLAEVQAKRRIVELHKPTEEIVEWFDAPETGRAAVCPSCHPAEPTPWDPPVGAGIRPAGFIAAYVLAPCPTLCLLALPYADHPDYRPEWRP